MRTYLFWVPGNRTVRNLCSSFQSERGSWHAKVFSTKICRLKWAIFTVNDHFELCISTCYRLITETNTVANANNDLLAEQVSAPFDFSRDATSCQHQSQFTASWELVSVGTFPQWVASSTFEINWRYYVAIGIPSLNWQDSKPTCCRAFHVEELN